MVKLPDQTETIFTTPHAPSKERLNTKKNAATGASAASVRAIASQMVAFYFRAPAKAFFPARVDYLAFARAINPRVQAKEAWSWRISTAGLLTHAVQKYGWGFIPNQVLPPMLANVGIGAVLYASYLQVLGSLHQPSSQSLKRVYPPPPVSSTLAAGFAAGAIQSLVAAPLDALQVRFRTSDVLDGKYKSMWQYGRRKLQEIGIRAVFAGWRLSLLKDSLGSAAFFATFEFVKAQCCYEFVSWYYGNLRPSEGSTQRAANSYQNHTNPIIIKPHYAIGPTFLMLAGLSASLVQQVIQHPLTIIQQIHHACSSPHERSTSPRTSSQAPSPSLHPTTRDAYGKTYKRCVVYARRFGGWRQWLYRGFWQISLKQIPSTSAGLVVFELVRRRYGSDTEVITIRKGDYYDILLP